MTAVLRQEDDTGGRWGLRPGAKLPAENELRRLLSPDAWCAYEAMVAGNYRLRQAGLSKADRLSALPAEKMRIAADQLTPPEVSRFFLTRNLWPGPHHICFI